MFKLWPGTIVAFQAKCLLLLSVYYYCWYYVSKFLAQLPVPNFVEIHSPVIELLHRSKRVDKHGNILKFVRIAQRVCPEKKRQDFLP